MALAVCLLMALIPKLSAPAAAAYFNESDLSQVRTTIISNPNRANYVNSMMKYHILSEKDNYRVARNLNDGKSIVFFFDGCSDNVDSATYGDYNKYRLSAYCAVVQKVSGVPKIVFESEDCSTLPDNPRNPALNEGDPVPTLLDGVYNIKSTNHKSRYAALKILDNSGTAPVIRCTSSGSYLSTSEAINIHARSGFAGTPTNGISASSYSSTGCFNVGLTSDSWAEYNRFIQTVLGVSRAVITTPYENGRWTKCTVGLDKGLVIVDRSQYKAQLNAIYGGDNNHSASALVSKITAYTDNLGANTHTAHTFTGSFYLEEHPHKQYRKCACGAVEYTGATGKQDSCAACHPVTATDKYAAVLPFLAYLKKAATVIPYTTPQLTATAGEIWATDRCTVKEVYSNGACKVSYPAGSKEVEAYLPLSEFVGSTSASLTKQVVSAQIKAYIRADTNSTSFGHTDPGDVIYKLGTSGNMTQIFYPSPSGYKLAWVVTSELTGKAPDADGRFNRFCPISGYPYAAANFDVYGSDRKSVTGTIFTSDFCTINAVYSDGWCQVTYPTKGDPRTAYTPLSSFVANPAAAPVEYKASAKTTVYKTKSLGADPGWYIDAGDTFYVVGASGSASQVLYPIDVKYGGGYKLGWITTASLPKSAYQVCYNANGGTGAPAAQTKSRGVALTLSSAVPQRTGYTFAGWASTPSATAATYGAGALYTRDEDVTLYAVWSPNKYEVSYHANGGTNAPGAQSKIHGTALKLSGQIPVKHYTVTFNANGGSGVAARQVSCEFLGWSAGSAGTTVSYQPGSSYTANAGTTLYAVWKNSQLSYYDTPVREGYVFDGWYTAANGGTRVNASDVISANMTLYAHWVPVSYSVRYDANGGSGAPSAQSKTHGKDLVLSSAAPVREGCTFLGWAVQGSGNAVRYQPGDRYTANADAVLTAVWQQINLTGIRIATKPTVTAYNVGDTLNTAGLTLTASYSDGTTGTVTDGFTCTPVKLQNPGTQRITVTYGGMSTSFTVNVKEQASGALSVGKASGAAGELVVVPVRINSNPGIISARIRVSYDSSVLTLVKAEDGGILGEYVFGNKLSANPYTMLWENGLSKTDFTATGTLVYLTFRVAENAPLGSTEVSVSYDPEDVYNVDLTDIPFTVTQGSVTVKEKEVDPNAPCIVIGDATAAAGKTVKVTVALRNNPGVASMKLKVTFDHLLTLTEVAYNDSIGGQFQQPQKLTSPVTLNWINALANANGDWVFATLTFLVDADAPDGAEAGITVSYDPEDVYDRNETNIGFQVDNGVVTVSAYLPGDINGDGKVNNRDATRLLQYLSDWDVEVVEAALDTNGDGKVNNRDATRLLQYLSDWDVELH